MASKRLAQGGRIDRQRPVTFHFNGRAYQGYAGDTVASALLANGVSMVGRSWKYHRPRGIVSCGVEEPNAILQVEEGAYTVPNPKATEVDLYDGLKVGSVNAWPSLEFDLLGVNRVLTRFLPAGFYYKTFMWPKSFWHSYEKVIRKASGLGEAPVENDPDRYEKTHAHCDVLVVGSGPAGLAAALAAAQSGARVIVADEHAEFGGSLLFSREQIDGKPAHKWVSDTIAKLAEFEDVTLLAKSTVYGYHDHNFLTINERLTDALPIAKRGGVRERVWKVRTKRVILATGAQERPLVFGNNDLPGVMLANAVSAYIRRFAVLPGQKAVVFTNNDSAYATALDLKEAGASVTVIDARSGGGGELADKAKAAGITIETGAVVAEAAGSKHVKSVEVMKLGADGKSVSGPARRIDCDLVAMSGGWSPVVHLSAQSGAKAIWDDAKACFLPGKPVQAEESVGAAAGRFQLTDALEDGVKAGLAAVTAAGLTAANVSVPKAATVREKPIQALWLVPGKKPAGRGPKQFVDPQNDVSAGDIRLAAREGYHSVEHVKRYTALGFGTDQGKLGNINGMAILADALNQTIPQTGTTTFRPNYTPVSFGAVAGRDIVDLFDPIRKTPIHQWHEENGAEWENVGQWKRPWYFPKPGETIHDAVNRECVATRSSVGVMDASTLGKIDIQGPDAAKFLNLMYSNAWLKLGVGKCRYGLMLDENGMVMDDGVTTRLGENHFFMTTTTGGAARVMTWLERWLQTEWPELKVHLTSQTDHWATVAVVGPKSRDVLKQVVPDIDYSPEVFPFMSYFEGHTSSGLPVRVMRISFSGELAYEINVNANYGRHVWELVMEAGKPYNITPYGTETMHVLRAEKGFIIVGQDTDGSVTPFDLGMDWCVGKNKTFIGDRSLTRSDTARSDRKQLVGLKPLDPMAVLPEGGQIVEEGQSLTPPVPMLGHVTSSYYSACLGYSFALALVKNGRERLGQTIQVPLIDGRVIKATICETVFIDPEGKRQHA